MKIADGWIQTLVLCQLCHNNCPPIYLLLEQLQAETSCSKIEFVVAHKQIMFNLAGITLG